MTIIFYNYSSEILVNSWHLFIYMYKSSGWLLFNPKWVIFPALSHTRPTCWFELTPAISHTRPTCWFELTETTFNW